MQRKSIALLLRSTCSMLLFFSLVSAIAAEESLPFPLPLLIEFAPEQFTAEEENFLSRMLLAEISGSDGRLVVWTVSGKDPEKFQQLGLPGILEILFDKEGDQYRYRSRYRRTADRQILMELSGSDARQSVYRNPARLFRPLREEVRELISTIVADDGIENQAQYYRAMLKINAPEGVHISISGVSENDGTMEVVLPAPSIYEIRIFSPRHFPETYTVTLPLSGADIVLKPQEAKALFLDLYLADGNVPGFQWGYRLGKQRRWFLKAGGSTYLATIIPMVEGEKQEYGFFYSTPLSVIDLQTGIRFGEGDKRYRPYLSGGVFGRVVHSSHYFGLDPIGPGGIIGAIGMEIRSGKRLSFFGEWAPHLFITKNIDTLRQFYRIAALKMPAPASSSALLVFEHFRAGIRIQL